MSVFERYLTIWVALCIIAGVALGHYFAAVFQLIGAVEVAQVNLRGYLGIFVQDAEVWITGLKVKGLVDSDLLLK